MKSYHKGLYSIQQILAWFLADDYNSILIFLDDELVPFSSIYVNTFCTI